MQQIKKQEKKTLGELKNPLASSFYLEFIKVENSSYKISDELMKRMIDKGLETKKIPILVLDFKKYNLKAIITSKEK